MRVVKSAHLGMVIIVALVASLSLLPLIAGAITTIDQLLWINPGPTGGQNADAVRPSVSADGKRIAFRSSATDIRGAVTTTGYDNIFVYDRDTDTSTLVTAGSTGTGANNSSDWPEITADGNRVVFSSYASDLVGANTQGDCNVFVYDLDSGVTTLVSKTSTGQGGNGGSYRPSISADGNRVLFTSVASNLAGATGDGKYQIFLYDFTTDTITLATKGASGIGGNGDSHDNWLSADGMVASFESNATDLVGAEVSNGQRNTFVYDFTTGITTLIPPGPSGQNANDSTWDETALSANGDKIVFTSLASNYVGATTNGAYANVFLYDFVTDTTTLVTKGSAGVGGDATSYMATISPDGTTIGFMSEACNLLDTPMTYTGTRQSFRYDIATGKTELISISTTVSPGNANSYRPFFATGLNSDGNLVVFHSFATDLVLNGPTNGNRNIYLWKRIFMVDVTFQPENGGASTVVPVEQGTPVAPSDPQPTRAGFVFGGWWTLPAGGTQWNFANPVPTDMTLYAHWRELFTVTYDARNGTMPLTQQVANGDLAPAPIKNPTRTGYTFVGWSTDPAGATLWDFATDTVSGDMTLYAIWKKDGMPPKPDVPPTSDAVTSTLVASVLSAGGAGGCLVLRAAADMRRRRYLER